jgi:hypothetical protein
MNRRDFLLGSATAIGAGSLWGQRPDQAKLSRIGVMSLCFNSLFKPAAGPPDPGRSLDIMDFADMAAERFGIHHVEYQAADFHSTEPGYFREFRSRLKKAKSQMTQINLQFGELNISAANLVRRLETIDLTKRWIDHASALGCPRVQVNQGALAPEVRQSAIEALRAMKAYGEARRVFVTMEPRNGPWEVVVEVIKASGIRANPDCGNFPDNQSRAAGLAVLYKMSSGSSHVKHIPDKFSTPEAIKISKEAGYKGLFTIEASPANGPDPYVAVQTIRDVLLASL